MMPVLIRSVMVVCSVVVLSAATIGCSNSGGLTELRLEARKEQQRLDNQRLAGIEGGLARSLQPSVYAASADDTLANLLPGGETVFSALSAAIRRDFFGRDSGTAHPALGATYVKSVSSDGAGGFRVTFVVYGRESVAHFGADEINERRIFLGESEDNLTPVYAFFLDRFLQSGPRRSFHHRPDRWLFHVRLFRPQWLVSWQHSLRPTSRLFDVRRTNPARGFVGHCHL